jgi:hypothetical protein
MKVLADLSALKPEPRGIVKYRDGEYPVMSLVDVTYSEMIELLAVAREAGKATGDDLGHVADRMRVQLKVLVPTLTDAVLDNMTYRELIAFLNAASGGTDDVPQTPAAESSPPSATE